MRKMPLLFVSLIFSVMGVAEMPHPNPDRYNSSKDAASMANSGAAQHIVTCEAMLSTANAMLASADPAMVAMGAALLQQYDESCGGTP